MAGSATRGPLVAVHTWRDEDAHYERLSLSMDGTPIVSIFPPPDDGPLPRRTEQWVDHGAAVLRTVPIEPPYRLIGWSFGGVVAVELARRLRDAGTDVAFVGMIDTLRPRLVPLDVREYIWHHLGAAAAMTVDADRIPYLTRRAKQLASRELPTLTRAVRAALYRLGLREPPPPQAPLMKPTDPMVVAVHTSYLNYHPVAVPFPVSIYATRASIATATEPALRWNGWLHGGFELVEIPGSHFSLWDDDNVGAVGSALLCSLAHATDSGRR